jgi:tetratricopeptide (TPR) repeat protein
MQITEMDDKLKEKLADNPDLFKNAEKDNEEEDLTDIEICYENFQAALNIYDRELKKMDEGEESPLDRKEVQRYKFLIHGRLGELYSMDQKYEESIQEFGTVVRLASDYDHPETQRIISEAHFSAGNALLHQNNPGCEELAIKEYISAVVCLIKYLHEVERYDTEKFEVPSLQKPKVDRYQYLPAPKDSATVGELKEVISMILDEIEDAHERINRKNLYKKESQSMKKTNTEKNEIER